MEIFDEVVSIITFLHVSDEEVARLFGAEAINDYSRLSDFRQS